MTALKCRRVRSADAAVMLAGSSLRLLLGGICLLLAACASSPKSPVGAPPPPPSIAISPDYEPLDGPPSVPFNVDKIAEPVVRDEPPARYGNHSPYVVLGKRYTVLNSADGYVQRGTASWYGTKFHGRLTSSREPYDMYAFTAAHKSLPLPSFARVTNLANGKSVVLRINDRGPFVGDRLIDLSYAAAVKLGVHLTGTAPVEVRTLRADSPEPNKLPSGTYLQVGAFAEKPNAKALAARLRSAGIASVKVVRTRSGSARLYRVRIGPLSDVDDAAGVEAKLTALGIGSAIRIHR